MGGSLPPPLRRARPGDPLVGDRAEGANVVKLAGNFTIAAMLETLGESFALVRKSGLDPEQFLDIINSTLSSRRSTKPTENSP